MSETLSPGAKRILHLASMVGRPSFGIGPVVLNLAKHQRAAGCESAIWCLDSPAEMRWAAAESGFAESHISTFAIRGPIRLGYSPGMERALSGPGGEPFDVLHQHGIWTALSRVTMCSRESFRRPTVIAPHGTLEPWALKRSQWKKRLSLLAYESRNLRDASCLQALSAGEALSFRQFKLTNPIAVIPNGISEAWVENAGDGMAFRRKFGISQETRILLFLSRITPKKGLPMLVEALESLKARLENWRLIIAGEDEFEHQRDVQSLVRRLELDAHVQFVGPLYAEDKRNAYSAADVFVLPSHSEGAPMVVLEALGAAVPVITTKGTPWEELFTHDCGWWTDIDAGSVAEALRQALSRPPSELIKMGERGRNLVRESYTWSRVAGLSLALYGWLTGHCPQPPFVRLD